MWIRNLLAGAGLAGIALFAWAQQHKPGVVVGVNWQAAPSSAISDGSMAWFYDAAQNRVMVCRSTTASPAPQCHAGELRQRD